jgi:hypothetical protein
MLSADADNAERQQPTQEDRKQIQRETLEKKEVESFRSVFWIYLHESVAYATEQRTC